MTSPSRSRRSGLAALAVCAVCGLLPGRGDALMSYAYGITSPPLGFSGGRGSVASACMIRNGGTLNANIYIDVSGAAASVRKSLNSQALTLRPSDTFKLNATCAPALPYCDMVWCSVHSDIPTANLRASLCALDPELNDLMCLALQ